MASRGRYALLVALPALLVCNPVGRAAKIIELAARKVRLRCLRKMEKILSEVPDA